MPSYAFQLAREITAGWPSEEEVPVGVRINLGCGKVILPNDEGWINVDHMPLEGVDVTADLFTVPWPFEDNYADYMIASHLIEHIPHKVKQWVREEKIVVPGPIPTIRRETYLRDHPLDGFFAFFAEAYRILKPGGIICTIAPYGLSSLAMQDPTHTRFIVPGTFSYLGPADSPTFDYGLPFKFEQVNPVTLLPMVGSEEFEREEVAMRMTHLMNAGHTIRCDLRAVKP